MCLLKQLLGVLLFVTVLTACGQKGPLVLPPPEGAEQPQPPDQNKDKK